jgi:putative transposase
MNFGYRNHNFWRKGYHVDAVGKDTKAIKEYVANELKADRQVG